MNSEYQRLPLLLKSIATSTFDLQLHVLKLTNRFSTFFRYIVCNLLRAEPQSIIIHASLKGKFSSGIEGALASTLNHNFNWKQLSEIIICIFF